jgi:hypothetical protein
MSSRMRVLLVAASSAMLPSMLVDSLGGCRKMGRYSNT